MPDPKYIARLDGVREIGLFGAAELGWWREHMAAEGLEPVDKDGAAQVLVTGLDAKWAGISFCDLSVSVAARRGEETGLFFARAFNTSRFLVFFEKHWFRLPYSRGDVKVDGASLRLGDDVVGELGAREPAAGEETKLPVRLFLPGRRWLTVLVQGATSTYDFDEARDRFEVGADCAEPVVAGLRASGFRGVHWHLRPSATHARTKTFK